jgi:hypothetical protein
LVGAQLSGALFDYAGLQGAVLENAELQGASFSHALVWRADARGSKSEGALVVAPETRPIDRRFDCPDYEQEPGMLFYPGGVAMPGMSFAAHKMQIERQVSIPAIRDFQLKRICSDYHESSGDWSVASFAALKSQIESQVSTSRRGIALKRIENLDPAKPLVGEEAMAEAWKVFAGLPPTPTLYEQIAKALITIGCDGDTGPYVIRGLLTQSVWFPQLGCAQPGVVAAAFLDETHCPATRDLLLEDFKSMLEQIRDTPRCLPAATTRVQ